MTKVFQLEVRDNGIAELLFNDPKEKVNKLSLEVLEELDAILEEAQQNSAIRALLIKSGKEGVFIAGADLKSFESLFTDPQLAERVIYYGHEVFDKLAALPFPTIAVIDGACLGGGMELALACTYRIVGDNPKTSLGLPETSLGIFPGWGGSQRLPRLVGLTQGVTMILSGKSVDAKKAFKMGLADAIAASAFLKEEADVFVEKCLKGKFQKRDVSKGLYSLLLEKNPIGRALIYWQTKKNVLKKTKGFYLAPLAALELIKKSFTLPLKEGLKKEKQAFIHSMQTDFRYAPALIHLFFNQEAMKKDPGLPKEKCQERPVKSVGVIGAGTMGAGIAWLMSYRGFPVRMKDIHHEALAKGYQYASKTYQTLIKIRKLKPTEAKKRFLKISGTTDFSGFQNLDLVIEAALEEPTLKKEILSNLEKEVRPDTIIATNTSSLTLEELSSSLKHPERFVGLHFFNPPSRMPLVEVVAGKQTSPEAVATAVAFCQKLKKVPVVVSDCSGFLVNRIFARGFVEAVRMVAEGVPMEQIDRALVKFGLPMAPFVLADEIGNDVNLKAFHHFAQAYGSRMEMPPLLAKVNEHGWLGKKVGEGFYLHKGKKREPNPHVQELLSQKSREMLADHDVVARMIYPMVNEAFLCLEEGVVKNPAFLDMALVFGIGFPPFRGGLLQYANAVGLDVVIEKLRVFEEKYGSDYTPSDSLIKRAKKGLF